VDNFTPRIIAGIWLASFYPTTLNRWTMGYMDVRQALFGAPFYTLSHLFRCGLGFFYEKKEEKRTGNGAWYFSGV